MSTSNWITLCLVLVVLVLFFGACWRMKCSQLWKAYRRIAELRSEVLDLRDVVQSLRWQAATRAPKLPKRGPGGRFLKGQK